MNKRWLYTLSAVIALSAGAGAASSAHAANAGNGLAGWGNWTGGMGQPAPDLDKEEASQTATVPEVYTGTILHQVSFREQPTAKSERTRYLQPGEQVTVIQQASAYWYEIEDQQGVTGFVSANQTYIDTDYAITDNSRIARGHESEIIEQAITVGKTYMGTPYVFGSNRNTTDTFDCSDFVRQMYIEASGLYLPTDSRKQAAYVKQLGTDVWDIDDLKRGDLIFFMSYKGAKANSYAKVDRTAERVTHVALYLGNHRMLHTYSKASGGVRIDTLDGTWRYRFLCGGSVVQPSPHKQQRTE